MRDRTFRLLITLIGLVCGYVIVRRVLAPDALTLRNALIQGVLVGFGLALVTIEIAARMKAVTVNGWVTSKDCGLPSNGMFTRAAHARLFPGPINVPQEAAYWRTDVDSGGRTLSGRNNYVLHFPPGGLPPNNAFWSLTMADAGERFVANALNRYSVSDRSGLVPNADGSIDIRIQKTPPPAQEANWLPSPPGNFRLWLRAYIPGEPVLSGAYSAPPIVKVA